MKLLFIQIGDLHWRNDNPISDDRFSLIGSSIRKVYLEDPDAVVFIYTGDFAHSGNIEEYLEVYRVLSIVEHSVKSILPATVPIFHTGVPGNHDCNFTVDQTAREHLLTHMEKQGATSLKGQIIDVILTVQAHFEDFAEAFLFSDNERLAIWKDVDSRLAWYNTFVIGQKRIRVRCFNTAWLSRVHEKQGALLLPDKALLDRQNSDLEISLFHHPFNWLESANSRTSRERILATSDIVFTGHEHEAASLRIELHGKGEASVFEGSALWEPKKGTHDFNLLMLDMEHAKSEMTTFAWEDAQYQPYQGGVPFDPSKPNLPLDFETNRYRRNARLEFTDAHAEFLDRSEIDLTHGKKTKLLLSDLFVFPDVKELNETGIAQNTKTVIGPILADYLMAKSSIYIAGSDGAGKTALGKQWCRHAKSQGLLTIYINGGAIPANERALLAFLNSLILSQYGDGSLDAFTNSPNSEKLVVIDDYQKCHPFWSKDHKIFSRLKSMFGRIVFITSDLSFSTLQIGKFYLITDANGDTNCSAIAIQPFSYDRRNDIVERWMALDSQLLDNPKLYSKRFSDYNRLMNAIIGNGYLQPFPPYILALLQGSEVGIELDLSTSTHGYLYEVLADSNC